MQYADIVAKVKQREGISEQLADAVTRSTVAALAELDPDGAVRRLAEQLPLELKRVVESSAAGPQHGSLEDFSARVSELSGVDIFDVRSAIKAVFATLSEAIGEPFKDMLAWLSPDFADLLPTPRPTADEFFTQVQQTGAIDSRDQAELAVHATLQALADRISAGQAQDLALHLPAEVRADLMGAAEPAQPFNRDEFLGRIATIEATDHATAELHAHAVLTALRVNVPEKEFADTLEQLPSDIRRLTR
jgi:uncharacterized protein (DUF2267 family)